MLADHTVISLVPIRDEQAARTFYEEQLGLRFIADDGFALAFEVAGGALRLTRVPELTPHPFAIMAWSVPDVASAVTRLNARGVRFERYPFLEQDELGVWTTPDGSAKVAWFRDPDGNVLSLVESSNAEG